MSYKCIIADDEPLVLIGLQGLIDWNSTGFEIIGQARNGKMLMDQVEALQPDLVISDIKMPVRSGLEVLEELRRQGRKLPVFIFLTSFEEFDLIKQALSLEAVDYIVKLELDKDQLIQALGRAAARIDAVKGPGGESPALSERRFLQERYLMRLLFAIDTHDISAGDVGIDLAYPSFAVACTAIPSLLSNPDKDKSLSLFASATRLVRETVIRYVDCYVTQLDLGHIATIMPFRKEAGPGWRSYCYSAFKAVREGLKDYFSLESYTAIGPLVDSQDLIADSFDKARLCSEAARLAPDRTSFFDTDGDARLGHEDVKMDSEAFTRAFGELNADEVRSAFDKLIGQIQDKAMTTVHAIDLAGSVLYLAMNMIPNCQELVEAKFSADGNILSYRRLYQARNTQEVVSWLETLRDAVVSLAEETKTDYRRQTVAKVQAYIKENVSKRLTLGEVASLFGYSQGYLSTLFTRYAGMSFIDYVNTAKIEKAKTLLSDPNTMVYEVAVSLGFESPFYFSKVFKKITGVSPTAWQDSVNRKEG